MIKKINIILISIILIITNINFNNYQIKADNWDYKIEIARGIGRNKGSEGATLLFNDANNENGYSYYGYHNGMTVPSSAKNSEKRYSQVTNANNRVSSVDIYYGNKVIKNTTNVTYYDDQGNIYSEPDDNRTVMNAISLGNTAFYFRFINVFNNLAVVLHYVNEHHLTVSGVNNTSLVGYDEGFNKYFVTKDSTNKSTDTIISNDYNNALIQNYELLSGKDLDSVNISIGDNILNLEDIQGIIYLKSDYTFTDSYDNGDILAIDFDNNQITYYSIVEDINISFVYDTNVYHYVMYMVDEDIYGDIVEVKDGKLLIKLDDPEIPEGYDVFVGWASDDGELFNFSSAIKNNMVLHAVFEKNYHFVINNVSNVTSTNWHYITGGADFYKNGNNYVGTTLGEYRNDLESDSNGVQVRFDYDMYLINDSTISFNNIEATLSHDDLFNSVTKYLDDEGNWHNSLQDKENINYILKYAHTAGQSYTFIRVWNVIDDIEININQDEENDHYVYFNNASSVSANVWASQTGGQGIKSNGDNCYYATTSGNYIISNVAENSGFQTVINTEFGSIGKITFNFNDKIFILNEEDFVDNKLFYLDYNGIVHDEFENPNTITYLFKFAYNKGENRFYLRFYRILSDLEINVEYNTRINFYYDNEIVYSKKVDLGEIVNVPNDPINEEGKTFIWYSDEEYNSLYNPKTKIMANTNVYGKLVNNEDLDFHYVYINNIGFQYLSSSTPSAYLSSSKWAEQTKGYIDTAFGKGIVNGDYNNTNGLALNCYTANAYVDKIGITIGEKETVYLYSDINKGNLFYGIYYAVDKDGQLVIRDNNTYVEGDYLNYWTSSKEAVENCFKFFKIDEDIKITYYYKMSMKVVIEQDGSLSLNLCNIIPKSIDYDNAYALINDRKIMLNELEYNSYGIGDRQYIVDISDLAFRQVADENSIQFFDQYDNPISEEKHLSVKDYLEIINDENYQGSDNLKQFSKDMLNLAAGLQEVYEYNLDNLANESLSLEDKDLSDVTIDNLLDYKVSISGQTEGIKALGESLNMKKKIDFKVYFEVLNDINDYIFMDNDEIIDVYKYSGNTYYVRIKNVAAPDLKDFHDITVKYKGEGDYIVKCNVLTYVYLTLRDEVRGKDGGWAKPMRALYKYAYSAYELKDRTENNKTILDEIEAYDNQKLKIAFVGDSLTFGYNSSNPSEDAYPIVLSKLFDDKFNVGNFGMSSAYVVDPYLYGEYSPYVNNGNISLNNERKYYLNTIQYQNSLAFNPDVVVIMLGSNDVETLANYGDDGKDAFINSLSNLINEYKKLDSVKKIYIATSIYLHNEDESLKTINNGTLQYYQKLVALNNDCEVIDINELTHYYFNDNNYLAYLSNDGLYPNDGGYRVMAKAFYRYLKGEKSFSYYSYDSNEKEINKNLFYENNNYEWGADPAIIYINDGSDQDGYYYVYCTSGYVGTNGIEAWRSKNLTDWQRMGPVFIPDNANDWSYKSYWAPKIIYNPQTHLYYLFYSAPMGTTTEGTYRYDSYATSPYPYGPFVNEHYKDEPMLKFEDHYDEITDQYYKETYENYTSKDGKKGYIKVIGPSPYLDDDGQTYFFFVADLDTNGVVAPKESAGYCLKLNLVGDKYVPDYSSLTKVTKYGYADVDGTIPIVEYGKTNEGPVCFKYDGKYYLTFLTSTYYQTNYQTRLAIADNPMGPYRKVDPSDGGTVLRAIVNLQRQGAGIRDVINIGDQLIGVYMTFWNNLSYEPEKIRKFAITEMIPIKNSQDQTVLQANGPTFTPQDLPSVMSGYENIANKATITTSNSNKNVKYLVDGLIPFSDDYAVNPEYVVNGDKVVLSFKYDNYVTLRSIMIYNSKDNNYKFDEIDSIALSYLKNGHKDVIEIGPIAYNKDNEVSGKLTIGAASIVEFDEIAVDKVEITIKRGTDKTRIGLPEIKLLGKLSVADDVLNNENGALYEDYHFENDNEDLKDYRLADPTLNVDGTLKDYYVLVKDATNYDLYSHKGDDGVYLYVDVIDENVDNYVSEIVGGKYNVTNTENNGNFAIVVGKESDTRINQNSIAIICDVFNEKIIYQGIDRKANDTDEEVFTWLRCWAKNKTIVKKKDDNSGYVIEYFIPYDVLGVENKNEVIRISCARNVTGVSSKDPSKFSYVIADSNDPPIGENTLPLIPLPKP